MPIYRGMMVDGWRSFLAWLVGFAALILLYLPLYPSMSSPELVSLLDSLPKQLVQTIGYDQISTGAGYTQSTFFGLMGFLLLTVAAIAWTASATGGAEESGELELTLAHGVSRVQYGVECALALLSRLVLIGVLAGILIWLVGGPAGLELEAGNLAAVILAWVGLGQIAGAGAFFVGLASGRRTWAIGAGAAVGVVGYLLQALAKNSESLEWMKYLSPYDWAFGQQPLSNGFDWVGLALLWGLSALLIVGGVFVLSRRDILG